MTLEISVVNINYEWLCTYLRGRHRDRDCVRELNLHRSIGYYVGLRLRLFDEVMTRIPT